jgi:hypothetical protein
MVYVTRDPSAERKPSFGKAAPGIVCPGLGWRLKEYERMQRMEEPALRCTSETVITMMSLLAYESGLIWSPRKFESKDVHLTDCPKWHSLGERASLYSCFVDTLGWRSSSLALNNATDWDDTGLAWRCVCRRRPSIPLRSACS